MPLDAAPPTSGPADPPAGQLAAMPEHPPTPRVDPTAGPHRSLLVYYALSSLVLGPFFWVMLVPYYFRYRSLRYRFDDEGVTMRWGVLFRKEISLTYARIQDIHVTSNVVERWLGLARIQVQTASASADAEMTIEGIPDHERIRDFLYSRMRGTRQHGAGTGGAATPVAAGTPADASDPSDRLRLGSYDLANPDELTVTLQAVAAEVRALRAVVAARAAEDREVPHA